MDFSTLIGAFSKSLLLVVAAILPIVNPPAMAPTFLAMTEGASQATRSALALRIGRNVALTLIAAMLVGSYVLDFFGISLPIVRVAGGMIVASSAWKLLSASATSADARSELAETFTAEHVRATAYYPMTFPITFGPGSLAASITIGAALHDPHVTLSLARFAGGMVGAAVVGLAVYLTYRFARKMLQPLGETGTVVFLRLSAFILVCVGVQIVWDGASELARQVLQEAAAQGNR
ncbi:MAG TPA: MarC family protein [Ottowia sp.]|uniref:MarC family protein n=1 Tax=Ottowia sp. TaxID=1898956 RepID=UPI001D8AC070|nr:MarC family protein [Ottowia sp.]MCP5259490.1 NAAT family transporter [Burkholderiaceae bacterium]MCB2032023.1 NAAT family transporter [Ottowia sp.]HPK32871.1 MarC family protein [Ottowia sp.]HPR42995.1 MarC family protein [Ottowia sp.]HRW72708.1 MarC family protein [Ottowia sp.]